MDDNDYVMAFDHFYTTNHIQILKSLLPFMENSGYNMLPAMIKYMELKYTLSMINSGRSHLPHGINACSTPNSQDMSDIGDNMEQIYNAIHRYLAPSEEKRFNQILSAFRTMKSVQEMQQMMELIQSMNPEMDMNLGSVLENLGNVNMNMNLNGIDLNEMMQLFNSMK